MRTCPDCKHEVSDSAKRCPNCGCDINKTYKKIESERKARQAQEEFDALPANQKVIYTFITIALIVGVIVLFVKISNPSEPVSFSSNTRSSYSQRTYHSCEADGCSNEGIYEITNPFSDGTKKEWYCKKHFYEMKEMLEALTSN